MINDQGIKTCSAFSMEALAILVALYIRSLSPPTPATVYSDCKTDVLKSQKLAALTSPLKATSSDASLLSACVSFLSRQSTDLCWIKGHPEKFVPDESLWTRKFGVTTWRTELQLALQSLHQFNDENHV